MMSRGSIRKAENGADTATHTAGQGRNPESRPVGVETIPASSSWTKAEPAPLMEAVVEKANMARAYRRVVANKGAPGADGMTVYQLADHLKECWPTLCERLLRWKSTRLNSSHVRISYAVFCLKKKKDS